VDVSLIVVTYASALAVFDQERKGNTIHSWSQTNSNLHAALPAEQEVAPVVSAAAATRSDAQDAEVDQTARPKSPAADQPAALLRVAGLGLRQLQDP
jgi:hypothetical protein